MESSAPHFTVPIRNGNAYQSFEQAVLSTDVATTEYRWVWIDGQKAYDLADAGYENASIGDWSTARTAIRKGVYDVNNGCFAVWSCK